MKVMAILLLLLLGGRIGFAQGFSDLDFEIATINTVSFPGGDRFTATVQGWSVNTPNYVNGDPNSIPYNDIALDEASVDLVGIDSPFTPPAIEGLYSIYLQGGTQFAHSTNGASIWQTAQIPATARSLIYWGNALQVSFGGQMLLFSAISNAPNYTVYEADISAYAGQTGELRFTEPWEHEALLDNIQFSTSPAPEPSVSGLSALGGLCLAWRRWRRKSSKSTVRKRGRSRSENRLGNVRLAVDVLNDGGTDQRQKCHQHNQD